VPLVEWEVASEMLVPMEAIHPEVFWEASADSPVSLVSRVNTQAVSPEVEVAVRVGLGSSHRCTSRLVMVYEEATVLMDLVALVGAAPAA